MDLNPLGIFFATSWTNGEKIIFRYPNVKEFGKGIQSNDQHKNLLATNHYALNPSLIPEYSVYKPYEFTHTKDGTVAGLPDDQLASMLVSAKVQMIKRRFELKISDVLFLGYMNKLVRKMDKMDVCFNVLFALQSNTEPYLIGRYQEVCEMIGLALIHEEGRSCYLSNQKQEILDQHEALSQSGDEALSSGQIHDKVSNTTSLGRFFRLVYEKIVEKGSFDLYLNKWIRISYCIYPMVWRYVVHKGSRNKQQQQQQQSNNSLCKVKTAMFDKLPMLENYLNALRPYHTFIMLEDKRLVLKRLSADSSPVLRKLLRCHAATKNLACMAAELDVSLLQVRKVVCSLVVWGCVMLAYPIYDSNVYLISPNAPLSPTSAHSVRFASKFPDLPLTSILSHFSLPYDLNFHRCNLFRPLYNNHNYPEINAQNQLVQMITWLLKHNLIYQLHKYIYYIDNNKSNSSSNSNANSCCTSNHSNDEDDDDKHHSNSSDGTAYNGSNCSSEVAVCNETANKNFISFSSNKEQQTPTSETLSSNKITDFDSLSTNQKTSTTLTTSSTTIDSASPLTSADLSWKSDDAFPSSQHHHHHQPYAHLPLPHPSQQPSPQQPHLSSYQWKHEGDFNPKEDPKLFSRLSRKYFSGQHHLEHIMFSECLPRARLSNIIDRFRDQLVICQHEELHISYWVSESS